MARTRTARFRRPSVPECSDIRKAACTIGTPRAWCLPSQAGVRVPQGQALRKAERQNAVSSALRLLCSPKAVAFTAFRRRVWSGAGPRGGRGRKANGARAGSAQATPKPPPDNYSHPHRFFFATPCSAHIDDSDFANARYKAAFNVPMKYLVTIVLPSNPPALLPP